jgi:hypothetical protein
MVKTVAETMNEIQADMFREATERKVQGDGADGDFAIWLLSLAALTTTGIVRFTRYIVTDHRDIVPRLIRKPPPYCAITVVLHSQTKAPWAFDFPGDVLDLTTDQVLGNVG